MLKNNYLEVIVHLCIVVHYGQIIVKKTYRKLTVAFNNIQRRLLGLPLRCSASAMYANYDLPNLDTVIRRSLYGFIQRLSVSQNYIVRTIEWSWIARINLLDRQDCVWAKVLYL